MAKKHSFAKGVATGLLGTAATVAGAVFAVKKTIIEPEEKKLAFIEENRKAAKSYGQGNLVFFCIFFLSAMTKKGAKHEKKKI